MSNLTELLPAFIEGEKIRKKYWSKEQYLFFKDDNIMTNNEVCVSFNSSDFADDWEFYKEPAIDWNYIIKNKCLCWFWDDDDTNGVMAILVSVYKDSSYRYYCRDLAGCGSSRKHCRPVRRDEVAFYEDEEVQDD